MYELQMDFQTFLFFLPFLCLLLYMPQQQINKMRKQTTMVAPLGRLRVADKNRPIIEPMVLIREDTHSCCVKFLQNKPAMA